MRNKFSRLLALLLCAAILCALPCAAFADEGEGGETPVEPPVEPVEPPTEPTPEATPQPENSPEPTAAPGQGGDYSAPAAGSGEAVICAETVEDGVLDSDELKKLVEDFLDARGIPHDRFRLGYTYTGTGETWYYNGDEWSYSASVYKLPLMMMLAQKVAHGELKQDDKVCGVDLSYAEQVVLTYSNNDYAHVMINYFDSELDYRTQQVAMSDVPVEDIPKLYFVSSHFSPRFIIGVLRNLYENPEEFPNIIECLKPACEGMYLSRSLGKEYEVAQKYGAYEEYNNIAGIVYMPNPIFIAIMTKWVGNAEGVISDAGRLLADYTLTLDERLAEREAAAKAEERRLREEEAERLRLEEQARAEAEEKAAAEAAAASPAPEQVTHDESAILRNRLICAAVLVAAAAAAITAGVLHGRRRRHRRAAHRGRHSA